MAVKIDELQGLVAYLKSFQEVAEPNAIQVQGIQDRCDRLIEALDEQIALKRKLNVIYGYKPGGMVRWEDGGGFEYIDPMEATKRLLFRRR